MEFYIVGSALTEEEPRDVDMFGVMGDATFRVIFDMTPEEFTDMRDNEPWDPVLVKWEAQNIGAIRAMQFIFPQLVPIDFKYLPKSLLHEPCRRVKITAPPESWGIGFPNLENHAVERCPDDEL